MALRTKTPTPEFSRSWEFFGLQGKKHFVDGGVHKLRLQDLSFLTTYPPSVYIFYGIKVYKKSIFFTTYPPPLVNVVCERPLNGKKNLIKRLKQFAISFHFLSKILI